MKAKIIIESGSKRKVELLIKVAEEMGLTVKPDFPIDEITVVSEPSLKEAWNSKEDERWDKLYGKKKHFIPPYFLNFPRL